MATQENLGRYYSPDERDHNFLLRELTGTPRLASLREWRYWHSPVTLDQIGPRCVGYQSKSMLLNGPIKRVTATTPHQVYDWAQNNDEWPGVGYPGTSVRAGMDALRHYGEISEYRWAFTLDDAIRWVLEYGPLVMGTTWKSGMSEPGRRPDGSWWIEFDGEDEGGHCWGITGANRTLRKARIKQTWGQGYGNKGDAWIDFDNLDAALRDDGEACCPTELALV